MTPPRQANLTCFVSIHDVAPDTLDQTDQLLQLWEQGQASQGQSFVAELLVIPGLEWNARQVEKLRRYADQGHQLVGHGWIHQCGNRKNLWHRIHSLCLSRNVAEHLSKPESEIQSMLYRCFDWFLERNLPAPRLYVPPAWAMGRLSHRSMRELPFQFFENLYGYLDSKSMKFRKTPLVGFEADTGFRSFALKGFNYWNLGNAMRRKQPVRISLHPFDLDYRLAQQIHALAETRLDCVTAADWLSEVEREASLETEAVA